MFIVVDGIIGAGKTTIIRDYIIPALLKLGLKVVEIKEPVDLWQTSGRLEQFYNDPKHRSFQFQIMAFHDRITEVIKMASEKADVFISERSILTDTIFAKTLFDTGMMDKTEFEDYHSLWKMWSKLMPIKPDLFIYLRPPIDVCMQRIKKRNRKGEENIELDYQEKLLKYHDETFMDKIEFGSKIVKCIRVENNDECIIKEILQWFP